MLTERVKRFALRLFPNRSAQSQYHPRGFSDAHEAERSVVRQLVEPGAQVIDVGANLGRYTAFLAELVGERGRVFGIEPIPLTYSILTSNIRRLRLANVELFNLAISSTAGKVPMQVPSHASGGENFYQARIVSEACGATLGPLDVPSMTLDALFGDRRGIDFVKCHVEGHELECLHGAGEILRKAKPAWLIEISDDPDDADSSANAVLQIMESRGYEPFWFDGTKLYPRRSADRRSRYFFLTQRHLRRLPASWLR